MRKGQLFAITLGLMLLAFACKKDEETNPSNNNSTPACADGNVCFKAGSKEVSSPGGGYYFADTFLFVKYEKGAEQLSLDIFGKNTGSYTVSNKRDKGNARIYWYPEASNQLMYMAYTGSFNVTELTTDKKITGSFSGTLYKYDSNNNTYDKSDSVIIKDGYFTKVQLN